MPRGGARPGAGRPRKAAAAPPPLPANVIPISGPRLTIGQALEGLRAPAPAPGIGGGSPPVPPPPSLPGPAPAPGTTPAAPPPAPSASNKTFARMAAVTATGVAEMVISDSLKKKGLEPNQPGDDDLEQCEDTTAEAIAIALGDTIVPWWAGMALAYGNLYMSMRMGARKREPDEAAEEPAPAAEVAPAAPVSPLGQAPGAPAHRPARSGTALTKLEPIKPIGPPT